MSRKKEMQEDLKPHYSEEGWRTVEVSLNEPMIRLLSDHLLDVRHIFDLTPETRDIAWLIDEKRVEIERALCAPRDIDKPKEKPPARRRYGRKKR